MVVSVYVDGSGGSDSGYGFFVKETGESFYEKKAGITNNEAEYLAIIAALKKFVDSNEEITIYSDSKNTGYQEMKTSLERCLVVRDLQFS